MYSAEQFSRKWSVLALHQCFLPKIVLQLSDSNEGESSGQVQNKGKCHGLWWGRMWRWNVQLLRTCKVIINKGKKDNPCCSSFPFYYFRGLLQWTQTARNIFTEDTKTTLICMHETTKTHFDSQPEVSSGNRNIIELKFAFDMISSMIWPGGYA